MNEKETNELEDFVRQRHICFHQGVCLVIDRGLAICRIGNNRFCDIKTCALTKSEEKNES